VVRIRQSGQLTDARNTKQQSDEVGNKAQEVTILMIMRQNGKEEDAWRGSLFWWPVIAVPA
jgi:hypothetical protein